MPLVITDIYYEFDLEVELSGSLKWLHPSYIRQYWKRNVMKLRKCQSRTCASTCSMRLWT